VTIELPAPAQLTGAVAVACSDLFGVFILAV
jgi:hypothetical protein